MEITQAEATPQSEQDKLLVALHKVRAVAKRIMTVQQQQLDGGVWNASFESNAKYVVSLHHHKCSRQPSATISLRVDVETLICCFLEQQDDLSPRS